MPKYYINSLRINANRRINQYFGGDEKFLDTLKLPYELKYSNLDKCDIYFGLTKKIESIEKEKLLLNLLKVEKNLKKIAFLLNMDDETVESIVEKNSIFFKNGDIDLKKIEDNCKIWENDLIIEIAKRSTKSVPAIDNNVKLLGLPREELKEYYGASFSKNGEEYEIRKEIVEKLMVDAHSIQNMSEISGIEKFYVDIIVDDENYNKFLSKYYDKYANEELIKYTNV